MPMNLVWIPLECERLIGLLLYCAVICCGWSVGSSAQTFGWGAESDNPIPPECGGNRSAGLSKCPGEVGEVAKSKLLR